jgi:rhodanese-related sulfurtransferase
VRALISTLLCSVLLVLAIAFPIFAFENISPLEVKQKLDAGEDIFILDVRQPEEYAGGYVPKARLIPLGEIDQRLNEIPRDKPVIVVCRSGGRSTSASQKLDNHGFDNIHNMTGGTLAWKALPAYLYIKAQDLQDQLADLDAFILDVRTATEYSERHITGAVSIPLDQLSDRRDEIPQDKGIIVVGQNDVQGAQAAEELIQFGYSDVKNLEDGMLAWDYPAGVSVGRKRITTFGALKTALPSVKPGVRGYCQECDASK